MYTGTIIIHNIPKYKNNMSIASFELYDSSIENFKCKVAEIFESNGFNIKTTLFQKSGSIKLFTFDQMLNVEFIFTTINAFLITNK
jgi:hypothetical protein